MAKGLDERFGQQGIIKDFGFTMTKKWKKRFDDMIRDMRDEGEAFSREELEGGIGQATNLMIGATTVSDEPTVEPVAEVTRTGCRDRRASRVIIQGSSNPEEQKFFIESLGVTKLKRKG